MPKWWVPDVMSKGGNLNQIEVYASRIIVMHIQESMVKTESDTLRNLRDFQGMRQPIAKEIAFVSGKKLRFSLQSAPCRAMYNSSVIASKW